MTTVDGKAIPPPPKMTQCYCCNQTFPIVEAQSCQNKMCPSLPLCQFCYGQHMALVHEQGVLS